MLPVNLELDELKLEIGDLTSKMNQMNQVIGKIAVQKQDSINENETQELE